MASLIISGLFFQSLVKSPRFYLFVKTPGQSILSNLKHLLLYGVPLTATLVQIIHSFDQLESLGISKSRPSSWYSVFRLNLPMLSSVQLVQLKDGMLTLNATRLKKVWLVWCSLSLQYFYLFKYKRINSTLLNSLKKARENLSA